MLSFLFWYLGIEVKQRRHRQTNLRYGDQLHPESLILSRISVYFYTNEKHKREIRESDIAYRRYPSIYFYQAFVCTLLYECSYIVKHIAVDFLINNLQPTCQ